MLLTGFQKPVAVSRLLKLGGDWVLMSKHPFLMPPYLRITTMNQLVQPPKHRIGTARMYLQLKTLNLPGICGPRALALKKINPKFILSSPFVVFAAFLLT